MLGGRSLVARAVDAARGARQVTRVVGSTDDPVTARAMQAAGAEVPALRPSELATDDAPDTPVFLHMLELLAGQGYEPDLVVNVRPTAPLRTGRDIDAAIDILVENPWAASVKSVCLVTEHPYKMWTLHPDRSISPVLASWRDTYGGDPDVARQLLPEVYRSNGAVDVTRAATLRTTRSFHGGKTVAYVMDPLLSVDVDEVAHLALAESQLQVSW